MKNQRLLSFLGVLLLALFVVSSCKKDKDEETTPTTVKPVLGTNFNYTVSINKVLFTTTLSGNVWWTCNGTDYTAVDKKAEVAFAEAGTYSFTCSYLSNGSTLTSAAFDVVITEGDTTVYNTDWWKGLTSGYGKQKAWVLDVEGKVFPGPLSFMGTSWNFVTEQNEGDDAWLWDAGIDFIFPSDSASVRLDWPGTEGYGVMYFNLIDGKHYIADKKKEAPEEGTYDLNWDTRTLTINGGTILRSYKPFAVVEGQTGTVNGIAGISDWANYKVYKVSDSVLRLAVLRDQDVQGEGACYLIYNFVEKDIYNSITINPVVFVEPKKQITATDLVGTWKYATVAQDWIGWPEQGTEGGKRLNSWTTREDMATTLAGWGATDPLTVFNTAADFEYTFNADGTCVLNGIANTWSVADGVITFGTDLTSEFSLVWIGLTGKNVSVLDVRYDANGNAYIADGMWMGQKNGDKYESSSVQLVKVR